MQQLGNPSLSSTQSALSSSEDTSRHTPMASFGTANPEPEHLWEGDPVRFWTRPGCSRTWIYIYIYTHIYIYNTHIYIYTPYGCWNPAAPLKIFILNNCVPLPLHVPHGLVAPDAAFQAGDWSSNDSHLIVCWAYEIKCAVLRSWCCSWKWNVGLFISSWPYPCLDRVNPSLSWFQRNSWG